MGVELIVTSDPFLKKTLLQVIPAFFLDVQSQEGHYQEQTADSQGEEVIEREEVQIQKGNDCLELHFISHSLFQE